MTVELKYNNETALKCEQNEKHNVYISWIFNIEIYSAPIVENSLYTVKKGDLLSKEEISLINENNIQQLLITSDNMNSLASKSLWSLCDKTGVISRKDTIINKGEELINLSNALATFTFAPGNYEVYSETSEWCCENQGQWKDISDKKITLRNKDSRTTEGGTPYICLREKSSGKGLVFHIIPHGNWVIKIKTDSRSTDTLPKTILELGISDEVFNLPLAPGAHIELPEILIQSLPEEGIESPAPALHQYVLNNVLRKYAEKTSRSLAPVVFNSWFDCFDRLELPRLREQLDAAKQVGCDIFVIDAGWFGGADISWALQTGDWRENKSKAFKGDMFSFSEEVRNAGLGFGLWMEPERFCKDVPILKEHPEWFLPGEGECFYPDLTLAEAYEYTFAEISRLIETYQLVWIKIDFNFSLGTDPSGTEFGDYYTKWYHLLDELKAKYSYVFFEGCASGAMRLDLNTLAHFDGHFLSDNVNPWDTLRISQGAFLRLPPGKITRWATLINIGKSTPKYGLEITFDDRVIVPAGNGGTWNEFESVDFDFAILAAMPGIFGLSGNIASFSEEQKTKLNNYIIFYKEWREFISNSSAELLTPVQPLGNRTEWVVFQLTNPEYNKSLLFVYRLNSESDSIALRLHGINKNKKYILQQALECNNADSTFVINEDDVTFRIPEKNRACCYVVNIA